MKNLFDHDVMLKRICYGNEIIRCLTTDLMNIIADPVCNHVKHC